MKKLILASIAIVFLASCQKNDLFDGSLQSRPSEMKANLNLVNTFYSSTKPVGEGVARAWLTQTRDGAPTSVGVTLSEKALQNLPEESTEFLFTLPTTKGDNFYKIVQLNWNPEGHFPPNVYDLPHFDVHFYIIPNEERLSIEADDLEEFSNAPGSEFVPELYLQTSGGEPQMGAHWVDLLSPEFNGGTFTRTFIWGSYDGKFIFWEPMITLDYLLTKPNVTVPVRQPSAFQQDGYYPYQYKVSYSLAPKEFNISLDVTYHEGSE